MTPAEVHAELAERFECETAYSTVLTMLRRLVAKGWAGRMKDGHAHRYYPILRREAVQEEALRRLQYSIFDGSRKVMRELLAEPDYSGGSRP